MLMTIIVVAGLIVFKSYDWFLVAKNKKLKENDGDIIFYNEFRYVLISDESLWLTGRERKINSFSIQRIKSRIAMKYTQEIHLHRLLKVIKNDRRNNIPLIELSKFFFGLFISPIVIEEIGVILFDFSIIQQINQLNYQKNINAFLILLVSFMGVFILLIFAGNSVIDSVIIPNKKEEMIIIAIEELLEEQSLQRRGSFPAKIPYRYQPKRK